MEENQDQERRVRLRMLLETLGVSQREFADKINFDYSSLTKITTGNRKIPTQTFIPKMLAVYPDVRKEWLLFGTGEMFRQEQELADQTELQKHMDKLPTRPRLPKFMSEGNIKQYYGEGLKRKLCMEKPIITQFSDYDFSLILKNNRMSPKYERGDEIFFKLANFPEWGNDFLLDTDDGPKFKRIYPFEENGKEYVRCVSYNKEEFPDFLIERKMIHAFYRCVGVLRIL